MMNQKRAASSAVRNLLGTRRRRIVASLVTLAVVGTAGATGAVALSGSKGEFVVDAIAVPGVRAGGTVAQPVAGLWSGTQVSSWRMISGPDWLSVDEEGVIRGTAPSTAPSEPALATVAADDNDSHLQVSVRVVTPGQPQRLEVASWNLDDAGANASNSAQKKQIRAVAAEGMQVIGLQETGAGAATELGNALGWHSWQASAGQGGGDLGLVSAFPITSVTPPTTSVPAAAATIDVNGQPVRVWVTHLDEADYGPSRACAGATDVVAHEAGTTRAAQANAVAAAMGADLAASAITPVLLLGDLASPAASDWTASTNHCDAGAVAWPVPATFADAGLTDSFRTAYTDPADHAGATRDGERIDYVDFAGPLEILGAESFAGTPATWPSDHAAAVTLFSLATPTTPVTPDREAPATPSTPPGTTEPGDVPAPGTATPSTPPAAAPSGRVSLRGAAKVGHRLRATRSGWPAGTTFSYRWFAHGKRIKHASTASLEVTRALRGKRIKLEVIADSDGRHRVLTARTKARVR